MLDAIGMLENDPQTEIIVLISKPPVPAVARKVLERARACRKPVVACFLGRGETSVDEQGLQFARGSKEAALKAVMLSGVKQEHLDLHTLNQPLIADVGRVCNRSRNTFVVCSAAVRCVTKPCSR